MAVHGNVAVIGAKFADVLGARSGAAYVYRRNAGGTWTLTAVLTGSDTDANDQFGAQVVISEDVLAVGANSSDVIYIFRRNAAGQWHETQKVLDGPYIGKGAIFALDHERLLVGTQYWPRILGGASFFEVAPEPVCLANGACLCIEEAAGPLCEPRPACGDGDVQGDEQCDTGDANGGACAYGERECQVCSEACTLVAGAVSYCGDGVTDVEDGEECDDGNDEDINDTCSNGCLGPRVHLGFQNDFCGAEIIRPAGDVFQEFLWGTITTRNVPSGPEGWSIALRIQDSDFGEVTLRGTEAEQRLNNGFNFNELVGERFDMGAISVVVLSLNDPVTLDPNSTATVVQLALRLWVPDEGSRAVRINYVNGLQGSGQPVDSIVTIDQSTFIPTLGECVITLTAE